MNTAGRNVDRVWKGQSSLINFLSPFSNTAALPQTRVIWVMVSLALHTETVISLYVYIPYEV